MGDLQVFRNQEFGEVRTVLKDNEPWFVGKDVAEILGYERTADAIRVHVDEEDKLTLQITDSGQGRKMISINESGLYSLILSSKLPTAKKFKRWVTVEVLPAIRNTGMYAQYHLLDNPDLLIAAANRLKEERAARLVAEAQIAKDRPKVLFAEALEVSDNSCLIGDLAKILRQNGIDIGQNRLFEKLRKEGYLINRKGESYNMPSQRGLDLELFEIKTRTINNPDGSVRTTRTPKVTVKGQIYFINKYKSEFVHKEKGLQKND